MDYPGKVITKTQVTPTQTSASGNWTLDDQAAAIKNNNWPVALVPNPISKSLRFNSADSAYLNRTLTTPTDGKKWTYSFWIKRVSFATNQPVLTAYTDANNQATLYHTTGNKLYWLSTTGGSTYTQFRTDAVYRDASAWYHFVVVFDSTNATSTDRIKMYVNGTSLTCEAGQYIAPGLNTTAFVNTAIGHRIGNDQNLGIYLNGYLTEVNFIDGQALTPSDFGLTNPQTGQWIPKKYTGTYGTNGFYLNFKDATSTTTLGYDYSGNANNWTTNNFSVTAGSGNDSLTDVPTPWVAYNTTGDVGGVVRGNYCTMNPLDSKNGTASNGNLLWTATASQSDIRGTFAIPASGKWYMECTVGSTTNASSAVSFGLATSSVALDASNAVTGLYQLYASSSGFLSLNGTNVSSSLGTWTAGDVLQIAVDVDNTKMWLGKNNTWYNSSGGTTGNPSTGANETSTTSMVGLFPFSNCYQNNATWNAGQRPFAYTPPAGFRSLCTTNLPATTIGFGLTNQGDDYFNAVLYTGNGTAIGSGGLTISSLDFQPDFIWVKSRSAAYSHNLYDAVRGATKKLSSDATTAENVQTEGVTAFNSNGFTVGNLANVNENSQTYVAWNWKANGAGGSNTDGTITSTVSANTTAGFSVVTYTGNGSTGTVGHGLGVAPSMMIVKQRGSAGTNWAVYHASLPSAFSVAGTQVMYLNATTANTQDFDVWNSNNTEANRFSIGASTLSNANGGTYVAYCFAAVAGYSAFGSYTGNGSADGPFVYCGFRPRWTLTKRTDSTSNWLLYDTSRLGYNQANNYLLPDLSNAEGSGDNFIDILSNGFKPRVGSQSINVNGATYIYAAFAEYPFQFANAR